MNFDLVTILTISAILLGVFYWMTHGSITKNVGELTEQQADLPEYTPNNQIVDPLHTIGPFDPQTQTGTPPERGSQLNPIKQNTDVLPYPQISNNYANQQANISGQFGIDTGKQPKPSVDGHLADKNFLESGHHYGIDTVSNTLKNANLQLRSDPIIPQIQVGPWMQSTNGPDTNHRQLEIGGDY